MRRAFMLAALATLLLSGCVLERVLDTHHQLCDASPAQVVVSGTAGGALRITFDRPTLTRDDVEWLVGVPPTRVVPTRDGVRLLYAAVPLDDAATGVPALETELRFRSVGGALRLAEAIPPAQVATLVPRDLVDLTIGVACKPSISLAPPGARFDLAAMDWNALPDHGRVVATLGPPHERSREGALVYNYCLLPCDAAARPVARFTYRLDAGGRLEHGQLDYFRYRLVIDRPGSVATLTLRL